MPARSLFAVVASAVLAAPALIAQGPSPSPVQWRVVKVTQPSPSGHGAISIELSGALTPGWHVYAQEEPENGPIPLRIGVDDSSLAEIVGRLGGAPPVHRQDSSFQLETEVYLSDFTLLVPIRLKRGLEAGGSISLNVRYQACNDHTCLPPRTVHLSVPLS